MAKGFEHHGRYNNHRGNSSALDRDTSHFRAGRSAEGTTAGEQGGLEGFNGKIAGFGKDTFKPEDPNLDYVNSGGKDPKRKSWS
jgi:hypothetical protein